MTEKKTARKGPRVPSVPQIWNEVRSLKQKVDQMSAALGKLKDMLNTTDNWHARISQLLGKEVMFVSESSVQIFKDSGAEAEIVVPQKGKLLYADRYTVGIEVDGQERMYNKGKIEYIAPA